MLRKCVGCNKCLPQGSYFKKQWKGAENKSDRRCKQCHQNHHKMLSKQKSEAIKASNKRLGLTKKERANARPEAMERSRQQQRARSNKEREQLSPAAKQAFVAAKRAFEEDLEMKRLARVGRLKKRMREDPGPVNGSCNFTKIFISDVPFYAPPGMTADEVRWRRRNTTYPDCHPDELRTNSTLEPDCTFVVSSGAICFGPAHLVENVAVGALTSTSSATVASYADVGPDYIAATATAVDVPLVSAFRSYSGKWCVYKLEKKVAPTVNPEFNASTGEHVKKAWFICHSALLPIKEVRRLLYHGYFGDELTKLDGEQDVKVKKQIDYHRFDYNAAKWRASTDDLISRYHTRDLGCCHSSIEMIVDGTPGKQSCIAGFAKGGVVMSFLLFDNDCDASQLYLKGCNLPLYHMPWNQAVAKDDEVDPTYFIVSRPAVQPKTYKTSKHRYFTDINDEPFATMPVYVSPQRRANGRSRKRPRTITDFFVPAPRAGELIILPLDIMNPHLLKFLTLQESLPLLGTCKFLSQVLDPYQYSFLMDSVNHRFHPDRQNQDRFLAEKAATSAAALQSLFKNKTMSGSRHDANDELLCRVKKTLIRKDRWAGLEHIASLGHICDEDFFYAIRVGAHECIELLDFFLNAKETAPRCTECNDDFAAYFCHRIDESMNTCVRHDKGKERIGLCKGCKSSEQYCQLCDEYECSSCYSTDWDHGGGDGLRRVSHATCQKCDRLVCNSRRGREPPSSCSLECTRCRIVMCKECNDSQWQHCAQCFDYGSGYVRAVCGNCSRRGCRSHGTKYLIRHQFHVADFVDPSNSDDSGSSNIESDEDESSFSYSDDSYGY